MTAIARFHSDPTTTSVLPCLDPECPADEHHELEVLGEASVEEYSCEHHVNRIHWHELTPADHPAPECEHGCEMTVERVG